MAEAEPITEAATAAELAVESLSNTVALQDQRRRAKVLERADAQAELESASVRSAIKPLSRRTLL